VTEEPDARPTWRQRLSSIALMFSSREITFVLSASAFLMSSVVAATDWWPRPRMNVAITNCRYEPEPVAQTDGDGKVTAADPKYTKFTEDEVPWECAVALANTGNRDVIVTVVEPVIITASGVVRPNDPPSLKPELPLVLHPKETTVVKVTQNIAPRMFRREANWVVGNGRRYAFLGLQTILLDSNEKTYLMAYPIVRFTLHIPRMGSLAMINEPHPMNRGMNVVQNATILANVGAPVEPANESVFRLWW
jgi:hypothetical protein